jgi:hypothetical protein
MSEPNGSKTADELVDIGCDRMDAGDLDGAVAAFRSAIDKGERWVALNLGNAYVELRRWEDSVQAYEAALDAGEISARLNLANVLAVHLFRVDDARRQYEQAWQEGDVGAAVGLAILAEKAGDLDEALVWLHRALAGGATQARWRIASIIGRAGKLDEAMALYEEALNDGEHEALISRALLRRDQDDLVGARRDLTTARAAGVEDALLYLADLAWREGAETEARRLFEEAVERSPDALLEYASFVEETARDPLAAVPIYERAAAAGDLRAHYNGAVMFAKIERWEDARRAYARAAESGDPKAEDRFEEWRSRIVLDD